MRVKVLNVDISETQTMVDIASHEPFTGSHSFSDSGEYRYYGRAKLLGGAKSQAELFEKRHSLSGRIIYITKADDSLIDDCKELNILSYDLLEKEDAKMSDPELIQDMFDEFIGYHHRDNRDQKPRSKMRYVPKSTKNLHYKHGFADYKQEQKG